MESAVPDHLRRTRTCPRRVPVDHSPAFASTVARLKPTVERVVMAYFGVQHPRNQDGHSAAAAVRRLERQLDVSDGPGHWDRATHIDAAGYRNTLRIAYWDDADVFERWFTQFGVAWTGEAAPESGIGTFTEIVRPSVERLETLFASSEPEGVAVLASGLSGAVLEHGYWGGARDRMPAAQVDRLAASGRPLLCRDGATLRVVAHDNACLIRSGQDWSATTDEERRIYLKDVEPVLRAGMEFLQDHGGEVDCYSNRYLRVMDAHGRETEKSFGLSWWRSLSALEAWAESHATHMRIFNVAMTYFGTLGERAQLRLYHEVSVAKAGEQFFEYRNCHAKTGMLKGLAD